MAEKENTANIGSENIIIDDMWWSDESTFNIKEKDTGRIITMTGCYCQSLKYNFPNEPEIIDSITLVGNNKMWEREKIVGPNGESND